MTIVEALKNLVLAFGGSASDGDTVVEVLKDVNETIGGTDSGGDTISEVLEDVSDAVEDNVVVPQGKITITANATGINVKQYAEADVNVPNPSTGKLEITTTSEVNCSAYATAQVVDQNLVAGNVKKDVTILGITGSYEGGGLASAVFPYSANVTYNVSGQAEGLFAVFAEFTAFASPVCALYDDVDNVYNLLSDIALTNGEHSLVLLATESDGLWIGYNPTNWTVTVSGDAEIQHEDDAYWIDITGDCTINAVYTG